jgi:pimeloyl-ACP methyl ester carboxylesterase
MADTDIFTLKAGRRMAVHHLAEGGRRIIFFHAAPGSGNFDPDPDATAKRKVGLLAPNRPGYGDSDPVAGDDWATVASAADDAAELLLRMQSGPAGAAGWSAGGRVALALSARHPQLVDRVVILATPAPDEEVPWIPPEQKQGLEALRGLPPDKAHAQLAAQLAQLLPAGSPPEAALATLGGGPGDEAALAAPGAKDRLSRMLKTALAQGMQGLAADIAGYCLRPWGFEPAEVQAKTLCLYGSKDPIVGASHGAWWQRNLPQARLEMAPGAGHLLVIPMWQRALAFLAPGR